MSQDRIKSLLHEERSYLPPRHGKDVARIRSRHEYDALCELARTDNDSFWAERARALLPVIKAVFWIAGISVVLTFLLPLLMLLLNLGA